MDIVHRLTAVDGGESAGKQVCIVVRTMISPKHIRVPEQYCEESMAKHQCLWQQNSEGSR